MHVKQRNVQNYITDPMFYTLSQSLRELTQAIRVMQRDMQLQSRETRQLHEVLRQCEMCRRQERGKHQEMTCFKYMYICIMRNF
jgi:hypothetical protein